MLELNPTNFPFAFGIQHDDGYVVDNEVAEASAEFNVDKDTVLTLTAVKCEAKHLGGLSLGIDSTESVYCLNQDDSALQGKKIQVGNRDTNKLLLKLVLCDHTSSTCKWNSNA